MWRRSGNKFGAIKTEYNGETYASKLEASYAREYDIMVKARQLRGVKRQVKMPLYANGVKICSYIVDFVLEHLNGSETYVEVKGRWSDTARLKVKLFRANYPNLLLRILPEDDKKAQKKRLEQRSKKQ